MSTIVFKNTVEQVWTKKIVFLKIKSDLIKEKNDAIIGDDILLTL